MRVGVTKTAEDGKIGGSGRVPSMGMNGDAVLGMWMRLHVQYLNYSQYNLVCKLLEYIY
jgi:hypothetical protein